MPNVIRSAVVDFQANTARFQADMTRAAQIAEKSFARINRSIDGLTHSFAGIGAALAFGEIIKEAAQAESALAQLEASIKATGGAAGLTAKQLTGLAEGFQKVTAFEDDAIVKAESILLTFTKIGKETFPLATKAILDFSAKTGTDLQAATTLIGKALNTPGEAFGKLQKAGILFSASQQQVIKSLADTGKTAQAQQLLLKGLEERYGGSAEAARNTLGGALEALKNSSANFLESLGTSQSSGLRGAMQGLTDLFDVAAEHGKEFSNGLLGIAAAAGIIQAAKLPGLLTTIATTARAAFVAMGSAAGIATGGLSILAGLLITFKDTTFSVGDSQVTLSNLVIAAWEKIAPVVGNVINTLSTGFQSFIKSIQAAAVQTGQSFNSIFGGFIRSALAMFKGIQNLPFVQGFAGPVIKSLEVAAAQVQSIGKGVGDTTTAILTRAAELTKLQANTGPSNTLPGGIKGGAEELSKLAQEQLKKSQQFFLQQQKINAELAQEVKLSGAALELEKLKIDFKAKVGRELLPTELKQLTQILNVRKELKAVEAVENLEKEFANKKLIADLESKHLQALIPGEQTLMQLKQQGIELSEAQIEKIRQMSFEYEKAQLGAKTQQFIEGLAESNQKLQRSLELEKGVAEILDLQSQARKQNKYITDQQLDAIAQQVKLTQELESLKKFKDVLKAGDERNKQYELSLIKNKDIRESLEAQFAAEQSIGRQLTEQERTLINRQASYKSFLEDSKRAQDIIKSNQTEQEKWNDQYQELVDLFQKGLLTWEDFSRAVKNTSPEFKKIKSFADDASSSIRSAIDSLIDGGKKISDIFKDLGKQLLKNLTNRFLLDPLERGISSFITGLFRVPTPLGPVALGNPGSGIGGRPFGFTAGSTAGGLLGLFQGQRGFIGNASGSTGAIQGGTVFANGPVYVNGQALGGVGTASSSAFSGFGGLGNIGSGLTTFLAGLLNTAGSLGGGLLRGGTALFRGLFTGNPVAGFTGLLGGLGSGFAGAFGSGSPLSGLLSNLGSLFTGGAQNPAAQVPKGNAFDPAQAFADLARQVEITKIKAQLNATASGGFQQQVLSSRIQQLQAGATVGIGSPEQLIREAISLGLGSHPAVTAARGAGFSFARGGYPPKSGISLVGERGPELFVPNTTGKIIPFEKLGGGQPKVTIINNTSTPIEQSAQVSSNGRDLIVQLEEIMAAKARGNGPLGRAIRQSASGGHIAQRG